MTGSLKLREYPGEMLACPAPSADAPPSKAWIKIKNPEAPATTRASDGTF
jgi:hypothetical protein